MTFKLLIAAVTTVISLSGYYVVENLFSNDINPYVFFGFFIFMNAYQSVKE